MSGRAREAIAPLYLLCCLGLGSAQNSWGVMILELLGLALLVWAALEPVAEPLGRAPRHLLMIAVGALVAIALQLLPLPLSLWRHLGGRQGLATDYRMLGLQISALPLSLTPYETLDNVLKLIPPLAIVCAIVRLRAYRPIWLAAALLAGTALGVALGAIHLPSGDSSFRTSHAALLAAISLPFVVALFVSEHGSWRRQRARMTAILAVTTLIILIGAAITQSVAGLGLALSVLGASGLLLVGPRWPRSRLLVAGALLASTAALISIATIQLQDRGHLVWTSVGSRAEVLTTTAHAAGDFMPFGSGFGSFQNVYRLYEDPDRITTGSMIHAHDDYLELALEMGLPGILLFVGFLAWWIEAFVRVWREADAIPFARAASIASALVLVDGLVDFPLRTASVGIVFAMCLALMADRRGRSRSELRPTRHIVLD